MNEPTLIGRQRTLLRDLAQRAAARARDEKLLGQTAPHAKAQAESTYEAGRQDAEAKLKVALAAVERETEEQRAQIQALYEEEMAAATRDFEEAREALTQRCEEEKEASHTGYEEARWTLNAMLERNIAKAEERRVQAEKRLTAVLDRMVALRKEAAALWDQWEEYLDPALKDTSGPRDRNPRLSLRKSLAAVEEKLADVRRRLGDLALPKVLKGGRLTLVFAAVGVAAIYPLGLLAAHIGGFENQLLLLLVVGLAAAAVAGVVLGMVVTAVLNFLARRQVRGLFRIYAPLCRAMDSVALRSRQRLRSAASGCRRRINALKKRGRRAQKHAKARAQQDWTSAKTRFDDALPQALEQSRARKTAAERRLETDLRALDREHERRLAEARRAHDAEQDELTVTRRRRLEEIEGGYERGWQMMAADWRREIAELLSGVDAVRTECRRLFPAWSDPCWADRPPAAAAPPVLQFGEMSVGKEQIPDVVPLDERLKSESVDDFALPALCGFPDRTTMLFLAQDAGRAKAVEALQAVLYRLLTSIPPGKVRITIIDPVGLGQNFAAFMDLADHDDLLVTSRIWTETAHIEQRLADLTAHMENVIQKYLRDRYPTINDYNAMAGEVAEPFRILVVANFPTNFSAEACRRLVSIAQNGPRCGVLTLVAVDRKQPMPEGFQLADLRQAGVRLMWEEDRFKWDDPDFGRFPLKLHAPPDAALGARLLDQVGRLSRAARHVEVPFEFIAPPPAKYWTADSRKGLDVPLGRSGATSRQHLRLGQGTAQHVLIAGKTGSGKSTLLHALITNLALLYSPDEVELYLVDFKKGVEFKAYAAHGLPHARVIAVESEREFGLSVLQRLDAEMKVRGERFRATGVQDLNAYRCATAVSAVEGGDTADTAVARSLARMPRILLIVDEFQEFFTEDDRIAQDAAQLLDRLVRQGRAFGLHVLLGSQTLGGAYSLARSTVDQMAIRIALQCSEADAQLILSADNAAARLLSRPGEAIYNDANGLVEGSNPFQVVWISDDKREEYLNQIHNLVGRQSARPPAPVVFEGNAEADVGENHLLREALGDSRSDSSTMGAPLRAWLGDALAINDLTAAIFRRQNGSNLLIAGQQDKTALGMLTSAVVSLAGQNAAAQFYLIDGRQADAPTAGPWARLPDVLPQTVRLAGWRGAAGVVGELAAELERRQKAPETEAPPVFLVIHGLQRCRDLRRREDDFGFARPGDEGPNPPKQFADLLRDGAALGIHALLWCDTVLNLQRTLDRAGLRELSMRVLFQMSIADSSNLIDNPLAGKLGMHRALFASEEDGRLEKFRPYGIPSDEWLGWVKEQLHGRMPAAAGATHEPRP
jgi:ABC-type iron transport system FetAB ATPase subunit